MLPDSPAPRPRSGGAAPDALRAALASRLAGDGPAAWSLRLRDPGSPAAETLLRELEGGSALVAAGAWREEPRRPAGALLEAVDALARWAVAREPELVQRFGRPFVTLLPAWRREPSLESVPEWRAGLADYALRGRKSALNQFFQKRNVAPHLVADLVSFVREAAWAVRDETGLPLLLWLERADRADSFSLRLLRLLARNHGRAPLLICVTTADGGALPYPDAAEDWRVLEAGDGAPRAAAGGADPRGADLLGAAAVFSRAFTASEWGGLAPARAAEVDAAAAELVRAGTLRAVGGGRLAFAGTARREAEYAALRGDEAARLHALALSVESAEGEPWGLCRHAAGSGDAVAARRHAVEAMERSWAVSDYDTAVEYARRALSPPGEGSPPEPDLLLALLHYEAERYADAERHFLAAVEARAGEEGQAMAKQMLGYNAVFGLGHMESGREILQEVLGEYEARGWDQQAGYVRNSIAFTLFRSGRFDEAEALENAALRLVEGTERPDSFLRSVLQLNLGRLARTRGLSDQAIELFRGGSGEADPELSPYILVLFHCTLGHLHFARGEYADALRAYKHCSDLVRDLPLEGIRDQVIAALSGRMSPPGEGRATRPDQVLFFLHLNQAAAARRLGLRERARALLEGLAPQRAALGAEGDALVAEALQEPPETAPSPRVWSSTASAGDPSDPRWGGLLRGAPVAGPLSGAVAGALAGGRVVAVARAGGGADAADLAECLVLCDPRDAALAERMKDEVGGSFNAAQARSALLLPDAVGWFQELQPHPLVLQEGTLRRTHRAGLAGLLPVRACVQVLSPRFDPFLYGVVEGFAAATGVPLVAALPFHLRLRDLAIHPDLAFTGFLATSIDLLVLGDALLEKTLGPTDWRNLLSLRPVLSRRTLLYETADAPGKLTILLRSFGRSEDRTLRVDGATRPILELCRGALSVAGIARELGGRFGGEDGFERGVAEFLRTLWREGAVSFQAPEAVTGAALLPEVGEPAGVA